MENIEIDDRKIELQSFAIVTERRHKRQQREQKWSTLNKAAKKERKMSFNISSHFCR